MNVGSADSTWSSSVKARGFANLQTFLQDCLRLEQGRLVLWYPLLLTTGIWTYFGLKSEPPIALALVFLCVSAALVLLMRRSTVALALSCCLIGFALAKLRTEWVATPLVTAYASPVQIAGWIDAVDPQGKKRTALTVTLQKTVGIPSNQHPRRVRLTVSAAAAEFRVGEMITGAANLVPLSRPVMPGGFDYGRQLYFQSIGATGYLTSHRIDETAEIPARFFLRRAFHDIRAGLGARIQAAIPGPLGSIADAMITGERAHIPAAMNDSLQRSGLFHILSISGLHMTIVAGGAFWIARALLALSPFLALTYTIKKIAAVAALVTGLCYMLLADSGPATERSYIMVAVMFFAVLVDRRAISTRNLAVAAILILVTAPEQALSASFQMSFMAVMGIAGLFEWWMMRRQDVEVRQHKPMRWVRKIWSGFGASVATSLVAGALSSIPAIYHFGRIAPYGVIANALALPIVSLLIMPMALAGAVLSSIGLETLPFQLLGVGLSWLMTISDWVASWQGPQQLSTPSIVTVFLLVIGSCVLFLSRSALRWLAALPLLAAFAVPQVSPLPDIYVDDRAHNVAIRNADGLLVPALPRQARFAVERWLRSEGDASSASIAGKRKAWSCERGVCTTRVAGAAVAYLTREAEVERPCPIADVIVAAYPLRRSCSGRKATVDRFDVWKSGAMTLVVSTDRVDVATAAELRGIRPWVAVPTPRVKPSSR
jgi:competence protein ComEC